MIDIQKIEQKWQKYWEENHTIKKKIDNEYLIVKFIKILHEIFY